MPETSSAWAVVEHGKPLQKISTPIPTVSGTEILIRVTHAGVCHSDLHAWEGFYPLGEGKRLTLSDRGVTLPRALGHEILGRVVQHGPDVSAADADALPIGASRIVYPWVGCQTCRRCAEGDDNLCTKQRTRGVHVDGGFSSYVTVPHPKYLVDHTGIDPAVACTFACSGITVLSAIQKLMPLAPQDPILLVGAGGLGLAAIAMLKALGHENITTADISPSKREAALKAGASRVVDNSAADVAANVATATQAAGGSFFAAIDFVNNPSTAEFALASLIKGGKMVPIGLMGGEIKLSLAMLIFGSKAIIGNIVGNPKHLVEVAELAKSGRLSPLPVERVAFDQANEAMERLGRGEVTGRVVLVHEGEGEG
jgi:alcohol dehydrogenase, propanol-preferring